MKQHELYILRGKQRRNLETKLVMRQHRYLEKTKRKRRRGMELVTLFGWVMSRETRTEKLWFIGTLMFVSSMAIWGFVDILL